MLIELLILPGILLYAVVGFLVCGTLADQPGWNNAWVPVAYLTWPIAAVPVFCLWLRNEMRKQRRA